MEIKGIETTTYMEMFWPSIDEKTGQYKTSINQVLDRDPLLFKNRNNAKIMLGFRFFDVRTVNVNENDKIEGQPSNYSPMYYFGKRLDIDSMKKVSSLRQTVQSMEEQGSRNAILCTCGAIITNPSLGDLTLEECEQLSLNKATQDRSITMRPIDEK